MDKKHKVEKDCRRVEVSKTHMDLMSRLQKILVNNSNLSESDIPISKKVTKVDTATLLNLCSQPTKKQPKFETGNIECHDEEDY